MQPPFDLLRLDHLVLRTAQPQTLVAFYEGLGARVERQSDNGLTQLRFGESMLDIVEVASEIGRMGDAGAAPAADGDGRNLDHFAVRVDPFDEAEILRFCDKHDIPARALPFKLLGADGLGPAVYITDPDGNRLELKGPPDN